MNQLAIQDSHTIIACPICVKNGNGRGALQPYHSLTEEYCLMCVFCGWRGNHETCQSYQFPCKIYPVVAIDLLMLENILSIARNFPLWIRPSKGIKTGDVLEYTIKYGSDTLPKDFWRVENTLNYLVAKGWLFPALYRVTIDIET